MEPELCTDGQKVWLVGTVLIARIHLGTIDLRTRTTNDEEPLEQDDGRDLE